MITKYSPEIATLRMDIEREVKRKIRGEAQDPYAV